MRGGGPGASRSHAASPDHDAHQARGRLVGLVTEAAVVELGIEEERPAVVEHLERLAGAEPVEPGKDPHHGLGRLQAADVQKGYLRAMLGEFKQLRPNQPKEVEFNVVYGAQNDLKPGEEVDVVTAWTNDQKYWHVWGMWDGPTKAKDASLVIKLP